MWTFYCSGRQNKTATAAKGIASTLNDSADVWKGVENMPLLPNRLHIYKEAPWDTQFDILFLARTNWTVNCGEKIHLLHNTDSGAM